MDAMDYEFVEGRDEVNDEANTLRRDVQILRECLERIVSYYDLAKTGSSLPSLRMQAKSEHENTMFGAARRALAKTANTEITGSPKASA